MVLFVCECPGHADNIWSDDVGRAAGGLVGRRSTLQTPRSARREHRLGASLYELGPGNFVVYHFHHGSEELLIVLRGRPTLRTPEGERQLDEGEVVHFTTGPAGAHGLRNDTDTPCATSMAGVRVSPEIAEYPDLKQVTGQSRHGIVFVHDVEEEA